MQILVFEREKLKPDLRVVVTSHTQICLYFCKIFKQTIGFSDADDLMVTVSYEIL